MSKIEEIGILIDMLMNYIRDLEPGVRVEYMPGGRQEEQANLNVYPPLSWSDERCLDLQEKIGKQAAEMQAESGFLILAYVYMPEQQITRAFRKRQEAERELVLARLKKDNADKVLAEAAALGYKA